VEEETVEDFLHAVPPEDKPKFEKLAAVLREQLSGCRLPFFPRILEHLVRLGLVVRQAAARQAHPGQVLQAPSSSRSSKGKSTARPPGQPEGSSAAVLAPKQAFPPRLEELCAEKT
jgi:hypothetical protein